MNPNQFRADFAEFGNEIAFPDLAIANWLNLAILMLNADRWGAAIDVGLELFTAHNLVLEAKASKAVASGGIPGMSTGPVSSQGAGDVSVSYDVGAGLEDDAGHWNLTVYGTRFIRMARMMGAGPVQIGATCY